MRQFVKLSDIQDKFEALGVGVSGMTYDDIETIKTFHEKWGITFPLLGDKDGAIVDAWGIRNEAYGEGTFAHGIPHPGVVLISREGEILAKWAQEGYRTRADWQAVLSEARDVLSSRR